jgi:hypothetical protein
VQIDGINQLNGDLNPGESRTILLSGTQCQTNPPVAIQLQLANGGLANFTGRPCGGSLALTPEGQIRIINFQPSN